MCDENDENNVNHIIIDFNDYEQNEENLKTFDSDKKNKWKEKQTMEIINEKPRFRRETIETQITGIRSELQNQYCCGNNSQYFVRKVLKKIPPFEESHLPIGGIMSSARYGGIFAKTFGKFSICFKQLLFLTFPACF